MPVPIGHPPIRWVRFAQQTCEDEEYARRSAAGVTYVRGKHGGYDFQDGAGAPIFAVCDGTVRHVHFGGALGKHQFVITRPDGSGAFYAHTRTRPPHGSRVTAGDEVAEMGNSSTYSIGTHLHFETLAKWADWKSTYNCGPDLRFLQEVRGMFTEEELKFLKRLVKSARSRKISAASLVRNVESIGAHLAQHDDGHAGSAPGHTHKASVSLQ